MLKNILLVFSILFMMEDAAECYSELLGHISSNQYEGLDTTWYANIVPSTSAPTASAPTASAPILQQSL